MPTKRTSVRVLSDDEQNARDTLRKLCPVGTTIHVVYRGGPRTNLSARLDAYVIDTDNDGKPYLRFISGYVATVCGYSKPRKDSYGRIPDGFVLHGCGTDRAFEVAYKLGRALFQDGFKLPEGKRGRNGDTSGHDNDGGYALNHSWI